MFLGLAWHWWLVIAVVLIACIPFKVRFMKRWSKHRQNRNQRGKWGGDE